MAQSHHRERALSFSRLQLLGLLIVSAFVPGSSQEPIKVIGASLFRSGTASLKSALDILGYHTFAFQDFILSNERKAKWYLVAESPEASHLPSAVADVLVREVASAGFNATIGMPVSFLFEHQLHRDPDAKVILSLRSSPERWADDMEKFARVAPMLAKSPWWMLVPKFRVFIIWCFRQMGVELDEKSWASRESLIKAYKEWEQRVRSTVPSERLLVHRAADGWGPLCSFLGVPVPEVPYPNGEVENKVFKRLLNVLDMVTLWFPRIALIPVSFIGIVVVVRRIRSLFGVGTTSEKKDA